MKNRPHRPSAASIRRRALTTLFLIAGAAAVASPAPQVDDDERIDIELQGADLVTTLESFAQVSGSRLDVDGSIRGTVTLALERTPWRQVLDRICRQQRLRCEILGGEPSVLRVRPTDSATGAAAQPGLAQPIDISLRKGDLRQTLKTFALIGQREVVLDDDVAGTLTLFVRKAPWEVVIEEACNVSGCRIEWGESDLRIHRLEPAQTSRRPPLSFRGTPIAEAVRTIAGLPISDAFGDLEVSVAEGLDALLDLEIEDASWIEALEAVCRAAACQWQLTYGAPSRLTVRPAEGKGNQPVALSAAALSLAAAAGELAAALGFELELEESLDAEHRVVFDAVRGTWQDLATELCRQAHCLWAIDERKLVFRSRTKALAQGPPSGAEGRRVAVRFYPPDVSQPVTGTARFDWTSPIRTFTAMGEDRWLTHLSWIPFGTELQVVVPTIVHCGGDGGAVASRLEPVPVPLAEPSSQEWRGAIVELSNAGEDDDAPPGARAGVDCPGSPGGEIHATFRRRGGTTGASLELEARAGTYLLVTPPAGPGTAPAAALLALGADEEGRQWVALLERADGAAIEVERRPLPADVEVTETLSTPTGEYELVLRYLPAP